MPNATQLLRQDHKKVKALFDKFEQGKAADAKRRFAMQSMNELEVHAQVEEEIFYPAVKKAIEARELVDEAKKEHQEAKSLIRQLKKAGDQDEGEGGDFEAKFSELMKAIQHHVEEEEGEMFPQVEDSDLDLPALGALMAKRKQELTKGASPKKAKSGTRSKGKSSPKSSRPGKSRSRAARSSGGKRARVR